MGEHFNVDTGELGHFTRTLDGARNALDEVRKSMADATPEGIGTKELDDACNEFQDHWKYGSEQIAEQAKKLAETVKQSKENYEEVERALEEGFRKAAADGGGK
ncbi:type VII secretion target [Streptomyces pathocidini]|uniref:Type VII secretion target n=1 Tax=Streptomyces pathocidini TaxID=1650571 RepID=A0ABW7ULH7_9ACTN|nr:type VII secretion target [Streptomyces pathocidini]